MNIMPVLGVKLSLVKEKLAPTDSTTTAIIENKVGWQSTKVETKKAEERSGNFSPFENENPNTKPSINSLPNRSNVPTQIIYQNETTTITLEDKPKESLINVKSNIPTINSNQMPTIASNPVEYKSTISEEMQLKAAYELQLWKEAREKEFEIEVFKYFDFFLSKYLILS
jgi:hypothetical protein